MSFEDFESRFLQICMAHRAQGRALAFAFILFDHRHPQLRHVLEDQVYWDALDKLSGRHLTVFSFDVRRSVPRERTFLDRDVIGMLVSIPTQGREVQVDLLSRYFDGLSQHAQPCILFFQVDGDAVVGSLAATLSPTAERTEEAYRELADLIGVASESLSRVQDEFAGNALELFNLIRAALKDRAEKRRVVRLFHAAKSIGSLAGLLKLISGIL